MSEVVKISDLINYMKSEGLLFVSREDYERHINFEAVKLRNLQQMLLRKDSLTIKEIVQAQLLPVTTRQSVKNWIDNGNIHEEEAWIDKEGKYRVITTAIIRLRTKYNLL